MTWFARRMLSPIHCSNAFSGGKVDCCINPGFLDRDTGGLLPEVEYELDGNGVASNGSRTSATVSIASRLASCPATNLPCGPRLPSATANRPNGRGGGARLAHNP